MPKVLVVDDEPLLGMSLSLYLQRKGCEVEVLDSGSAALTVLEQRSFDIGFFDINMPRVTGASLAGTVREKWPGMRVVLMTGEIDDGEIEEKMRGLDDVLVLRKPFDLDELQRLVFAQN
ncbi:MAG TPA: response regulator [bacterium]|nr:response regulator [bacterium]